MALLRRRLNARWSPTDDELPAWARERLLAPGMLDEYRAARGLDARGQPTADALARLGAPELFDLGRGALAERWGDPPAPETTAPVATARGLVHVSGTGLLAERLGGRETVELPLPATVGEVLRALARQRPTVAEIVVRGDRPLVAVHRDGRRLDAAIPVESGDELVLVAAISGG